MLQPPFMSDRPVKHICCIGGGYVGGPSAAVMANKAPDLIVTVVDIDERRIAAWNSDKLPVYEPHLLELIRLPRDGSEDREPNLFFSTQIDDEIRRADIVMIGVNTPTKKRGLGAGKASDLSWLEAATRRVAQVAEGDTIVVEKSTVPCGTAEMIRQILTANAQHGSRFEVLSNPEFLAEGTAVTNLLEPDRILIGSLDTEAGYAAAQALADVYANWVPRDRLITMNLWSSELSKLAANTMLAQRISSINALSSICEAVNGNIRDLSYAVGLDSRIGPKMLNASVGFGGSCFKKDVLNLVYIAETLNLPVVARYFQAIIDVNDHQMARFVKRVIRCMNSTLSNKKLAILGFSYKKDTGDTRESPAITVVKRLLDEDAIIHIFDPQVAKEQILQDLQVEAFDERVTICSSPYDAVENAHAAIILTEWDMFCCGTAKQMGQPPKKHQISFLQRSEGSLASPTTGSMQNCLSGESSSANSSTTDLTSLSGGNLAFGTDDSAPSEEKLDWERVARLMNKPAYIFDGRNTVDTRELQGLGFAVEAIGISSTQGHQW